LKKLLLVLTFLILYILQTTADEMIGIFGTAPNLMLVFTIIYSVNSSVLSSVVAGSIAGLLIDVSMNGIVGVNALLMMYTAVFTSYLSSKILYERKIIICITVFGLGFIYEVLSVVISNVFIHNLPLFYITCRYILLSCVYNTIVSIPMIYLLNKLKFEYIRGI